MALLVATADGLHDVDAGTVALSGHDVTAVAGVAGRLVALVDEETVVTSSGNGWHHVADVAGGTALAIDGDRILVGTAGAHLVGVAVDSEPAPVTTFDAAPGRETWGTPWGGPPDVRSIAVAGPVFVNVHVGGVVRSDDGGETWAPTVDVDVDVHQVVALPDGRVVVATGAAGFGESVDGGDTWRFDESGLHAGYARAVAVAGDTVLVTASTGPHTSAGALYRRPLGSDTPFERCGGGLPERFEGNLDSHWLAADGDDVALVDPAGHVWRSADGGSTWERVADALPGPRAVLLT